MSDDRPVPKITSARPVATWFEPSDSTRIANNIEAIAPAAAPASTPSQGLPVSKVTAKPAMAPHSIMPSTPRLSTPLFSTTSSPVAASRMGVVTLTTVISAGMRNSTIISRLPLRS